MSITPMAAPGSQFLTLRPNIQGQSSIVAGQPISTAVSPDGGTLLVVTTGYNVNSAPLPSGEYVFVYDISESTPVLKQTLALDNTFAGIAWNPSGTEFYVSGGADDLVHIFAAQGGQFAEAAQVKLAHPSLGIGSGLGIAMPSVAAGLAVNARGDTLVVANYLNDSVTLIDLSARAKIGEVDLRPGIADPSKAGVAGGEYPFWVAVKGNEKAYVSSVRDREIVVVRLTGTPAVTGRIAVPNGQPNKMILTSAQNLLVAALDNADAVAVIDTSADQVVETIPTAAPGVKGATFLKGSNPNSLALSPDERTLYVTNGGTNTVAVIALNTGTSYVKGLIPTGWYPDAVSVSKDGGTLYVANFKNIAGPNTASQYVLTLEKGGLLVIPVPDAHGLEKLTEQAAANNNFGIDANHQANADIMAQVRSRISHVIYIVKENRTYDQVLGDLAKGNGDPALAMFPQPLTPNQHQLALQFVTLDNFYDSGEVSGIGWNWSTAARATDSVEKTIPVSYSNRWGPTFYDYEGTNRNLNPGIPTLAGRIAADPLTPNDPNQLPGTADVNAPDSSEGDVGAGYLWDGALRQGLTVRNYGFFIDETRYVLAAALSFLPGLSAATIPIVTNPFAAGVVQAYPAAKALQNLTDPYFRGFDNDYPDFYRFQEWSREFDGYVASANLPALSLVRFMHDHTGNFSTAQFGVNTVDTQVADNDYAVGLLIEKVANSPYKNNTLIFVVEDDAQDGPDHVDAHRSIAFLAGPYVKQGALVSTSYTTVSMVRTIKDALGIPWMGLFDGTAEPMADVFDLNQNAWSYQSIVPAVLRTTQLPLPAQTAANSLPMTKQNRAYAKPRHDAKYWARVMEGQDFDKVDDLDTVSYNRALWIGLKGKRAPYPLIRDGRDLRENREELVGVSTGRGPVAFVKLK
jgi:YVTN family beta-propeller protein